MELRTYLSIVWRRKWIVAIFVVLATAVSVVATLMATPTYVSSTTLRVATVGSSAADFGRTDINYTQLLMSTYASILSTNSVRGEIREQLDLNSNPQVNAELVPNTELMKIRATAANPETAQAVANTAAQVLIAKSQELFVGSGETTRDILGKQIAQTEEELTQARAEYDRLLSESPDDTAALTAASQSIDLKERTYFSLLDQYETARVNEALRSNSISVVEMANLPRNQATPRPQVNITLGILVGLVGGVGLAFLFENLDTKLHTTRQIEAAVQLSPVGTIPLTEDQLKIVHFDKGYRPELEAFRRLRTNILTADLDTSSKSILITSAERGEGKSTIAANLAVSIAQSGRQVIIVDCDLRLPTLHQIFEQPNKRGLTDILSGKFTLEEAIQESTYSRLKIITMGETAPPNPTELLGSLQMRALIEKLKEEFDVVILDTPALLSVSDAAVLVPYMDSVVLVVARSRSRRDAVRAVRQQLDNVNAKSVRVVVNRAENSVAHSY